jgi:hypothetical protein
VHSIGLDPQTKEEWAAGPCLQGGDTAMDEGESSIEPPDITEVIAFVRNVIATWKEIARQNYEAPPDAEPDAFERKWPKVLENFFLAETVRIAKELRVLSEDRDN